MISCFKLVNMRASVLICIVDVHNHAIIASIIQLILSIGFQFIFWLSIYFLSIGFLYTVITYV